MFQVISNGVIGIFAFRVCLSRFRDVYFFFGPASLKECMLVSKIYKPGGFVFMKKNAFPRLIHASSASSDIRYASGFNAADEFTWCEVGGKKFIVVSALEFARASAEARKDVHVLEFFEVMRALPENSPERNILLALSHFLHVDFWSVPGDFPLGEADLLRRNGIQVEAVNGDFFPERAVKTPEEIAKIRASMRVTEDAMRFVRDEIASASVSSNGFLVRENGVALTSGFLRRTVESEFKRQSFTADRTILAGGLQGAAPHCIGEGPLPAGFPVVCDIFPRSDETGYWGDMTRTFCKGPARPVVRKAFSAVKRASGEALSMLRAGVTGAAVHECAARILEEAGFPARKNADGIPCGFFHGLGHGVGLDIHEQPRLSPANPFPLKEHVVVSVEPGLYDPAWGGIRLEDLVVVTNGGCENFCTMEKELEL